MPDMAKKAYAKVLNELKQWTWYYGIEGNAVPNQFDLFGTVRISNNKNFTVKFIVKHDLSSQRFSVDFYPNSLYRKELLRDNRNSNVAALKKETAEVFDLQKGHLEANQKSLNDLLGPTGLSLNVVIITTFCCVFLMCLYKNNNVGGFCGIEEPHFFNTRKNEIRDSQRDVFVFYWQYFLPTKLLSKEKKQSFLQECALSFDPHFLNLSKEEQEDRLTKIYYQFVKTNLLFANVFIKNGGSFVIGSFFFGFVYTASSTLLTKYFVIKGIVSVFVLRIFLTVFTVILIKTLIKVLFLALTFLIDFFFQIKRIYCYLFY